MRTFPTITLLFLVLFLVSTAVSAAQTLQEHNVDFYMAYDNVVVQQELLFEDPISGNLALNLPNDAEGVSLYIDDVLAETSIKNNQLNHMLDSASIISLSYVTKNLHDKSEFLVSFRMPYDTENLHITLTLPDDVVLEKPLPDSDIAPSPVYPLPDDVTTDGMQIKLVWDYSDLAKGDEKSFFVRFKKEKSSAWLIVLLVLIIIALIGFIITRKPKVERVVEKVVEVEDMLEKHLKEDEEQIVNILKQKEGSCEQGTLRVVTGFSKAKLSGLLKELEERKVVHKEKRGKKNLVFLRKL
ncbi:helix-turn-helix transcriptional regulator [candidate division KSB1 bacterium]